MKIIASKECLAEYDRIMRTLGYDEYCSGGDSFNEVFDDLDVDAAQLLDELNNKLDIIDNLYEDWDWDSDPTGKRKAQRERSAYRKAVRDFGNRFVNNN